MADRIKGITVEIGGDTTGLNKALSGTNKEIRNTQSQLKDVERLLKLDPSNTELLQQKQRLLADAVGETKSKLDALKIAEKQVQQQFIEGKVPQEQYDGLQREIIATTERLKDLEKQADNSNVALSKIKTVSGEVADKAGQVSSSMVPVTGVIVAAGAAAFNLASDMEESMNKVDVAFKNSAEEVKAFADTALETYGIAEGTALDMSSTYGDMATSMGLTEDAAADMAISLTGLAGDLSSFKNIGVDQAMTALNGIFTGETESLKTLGIVMTQTNLDAFALEQGIGKTVSQMTEAEKVNLRYRYVMNATKNAQGDFARTSDGAANSMRVASEGVKELAAGFGELLLPVITPLIQTAVSAINYLNSLDEGQKKMIVTVLAVIAAVSPVAGIISAVSSAVGALSTTISFLTANPLVRFVVGIVAVVAAITTLWNKSEEFRTFIINLWQQLQDEAGEMKDNFVSVFTEEIPRAMEAMVKLVKRPVNAVISLINGLIDGVNTLINGINSISFDIPDWVPNIGGKSLGFSIPSIPNIPMLADGGTVISGSAIVGEAGPELLTVSPSGTRVVPLTNGEKTTSGNIINFNATFYGYKHSEGMAAVKDLNRLLGRLT